MKKKVTQDDMQKRRDKFIETTGMRYKSMDTPSLLSTKCYLTYVRTYLIDQHEQVNKYITTIDSIIAKRNEKSNTEKQKH